MLTRLSRSLVLALVGLTAVAASGCFGSFHLTRSVYGFNAKLDNGVVRSLVMWGLVIIPVYELAALGDILIFNVVEFWSGKSAEAARTLPDGTRVAFAPVSPGVLRVSLARGGRTEVLEFVKLGERAGSLRRLDGPVLVTVEQAADGSLASRGPLATSALASGAGPTMPVADARWQPAGAP
jgi:hypothetical protein